MEYKISITGEQIIDKHTHYESSPFIGPERATIIIRGDIAEGFQEKYGFPITKAKKLKVTVNLGRNEQRVKECQDLFKSSSHLMGSIDSLDNLVLDTN